MQTQEIKKPAMAMYTVHQHVAKDMAGTFCQLAQMGYGGVEFYGEPSDFEPHAVCEALKQSGLKLTGWHIEWRNLQQDRIKDTLAYLHQVGCGTAVVPCLGGKWCIAHTPAEDCLDIWFRHIDWLNETAGILKQDGLRMGYHNHEHEFVLHYNGKTVFDLLYESLSLDILMEFDTGNCIQGGGDPVEVLERYRQRTVLLHLKPYSLKRGFDVSLGDEDDANDWARILHLPGVHFEQLLVEGESEVLPEMENAEKCIQGLKRFS